MSKETLDANDGAQFNKLEQSEFPTGGDQTEAGDRLDQNAAYEEQAFKNEFADPDKQNGFSGEAIQVKSALHDNSPLATTKKEVDPPKTMLKKDLQGNIIEEPKKVVENEAEGNVLTAELLEGASVSEADELKKLNADLGTNFKTKTELREAVNKADPKVNEQQELMTSKQEAVNYYNAVINAEPRDRILAHKRMTARQNKIDVANPEFEARIADEVDAIESAGMLDTASDLIKNSSTTERNMHQRDIDTYTQSKQKSADQKAQEKKDKLFEIANTLNKQESFYGLKVEQNDIIGAYKQVADNKLIDQISQDDNLAMEVALFIAKRESLKANSSDATYSDGLKAAFDTVQGGQPNASSKSGNAKTSGSSPEDFIASFVK